jgi:hypothetical protein
MSSDLRPLDPGPPRAAAEGAELAQAVSRLASVDGYSHADSAPLAPLARDIARSLTEAGFSVHHCARHDSLYGLGRVCLRPIPTESGTGRSGIAESRTTRNLLLYGDGDSTSNGAHQLMNAVPGSSLREFGYAVAQLRSVGAWRATGLPNHYMEARW